MSNPQFIAVTGLIREVLPSARGGNCCEQMVSLVTDNGIVNLVISADTYVVDNIRLRPGMTVTGFYDGNAPAILIFPPQFRAVAIGRVTRGETLTMDFFGRNLINSDNSLRLNIAPTTNITTANGQPFDCTPANRLLLVYYSITTRSIPAQTTPRRIIVMC